MTRPPALQLCLLAIASVSVGMLAAAPARAASLTMVPRSTWGATGVPSYVQMYIYVPDKLATKPPIMVSSHSCGSTATGQIGNIPKSKAAADANGFIMILPDNPGQNCWDVGAAASLKHDGGGDTQAIVQMVKYALTKYNGDPARVYAMGGSSGAMMTQALMAVYPDVFRAGSARAGVPAGCWADGYDPGQQWSNNCAGGNTTKTAQQWGDQARAMYASYTGHRPRLQIMQGQSDTTISYKNTAESVKQWTNVLGLSTAPTSMDTGFKAANATYNRQFWKNACGFTVFEAWSSPGGTHSMPYEESDILKFFGLDTAGGSDPETDCSGTTGAGGSGGTTGAAGSAGIAGSSGNTGTGGKGGTVGSAGDTGQTGGSAGTVGVTGAGGDVGAKGGTVGSAGVVGTGGTVATGGSSAKGGTTGAGTGGLPATGGGPGPAGGSGSGEDSSSGGCSYAAGNHASAGQVALLLLAGFGIVLGRRRRSRR
jgi:acetylxylan esterase